MPTFTYTLDDLPGCPKVVFTQDEMRDTVRPLLQARGLESVTDLLKLAVADSPKLVLQEADFKLGLKALEA